MEIVTLLIPDLDKLVSSKSSDNLRMAKKLGNDSKYIDDIGVYNMNNNNDFMKGHVLKIFIPNLFILLLDV